MWHYIVHATKIAQSFCFWLCCMLMTQISCIQCIKFLRIDFLVKLFGGGDFLKDRGGHNIVKGKAPWSSIRICICNAVAYPRMWLSGLALLGGGLGPLLAHVASVRGPPLFYRFICFILSFSLFGCRLGSQPAPGFFLRARWFSPPPFWGLYCYLFLKPRWGLHNIVKGKAPWSSIRICICIFFICNAVAYPIMWLSGPCKP